MSQFSVRVSNHTEDIGMVAGELINDRRDGDQADHVLWTVVDQKRRVDVEDEKRRVTEVMPASVASTDGRQSSRLGRTMCQTRKREE